MPKNEIDYSNTIIYKIYCKNQSISAVYVGHTTNFIKRKYQHKTCCNNITNNLNIYKTIRENGGWDNWEMIEIACYNCKNSEEARIKEQEHYETLYSSLNSHSPHINKKYKYCEICKTQCRTIFQYNSHIITNTHKKKAHEQLFPNDNCDKENNQKNASKYLCKMCDFKCYKKSNYDAHLLTVKHKNNENGNENGNYGNIKMPKNAASNLVCSCGKTYKHTSGLSRHKNAKSCVPSQNQESTIISTREDETEFKVLTNLVLEVVKQNQELMHQNSETQKQNASLTNQLFEICKNGTNNTMINNNSHNKTFNLNVFLNEQCKDAMNIMDFVDSLKLQLSDLENVGKLGFVEGISNIIVKNLQALDVHKRPVHCSDSKREVMYIKDEDKWEKENEKKLKLRKAIKRIANKNSRLLPEFKKKHPDCGKSESKYSDQYNKLIIEAMGGSGNEDYDNENKIIKKIAKEVTINK